MKNEFKIINLDLGAGTSPVCLHQSKPGEVYILFDVEIGKLKKARGELKESNINVNYVRGMLNNLPFKKESISHIDIRGATIDIIRKDFHIDLTLRLEEIGRILKPNGTVTISSPKFSLELIKQLLEKQNIYFETEERDMVTWWEKFLDKKLKDIGFTELYGPFLIWTFKKKIKKWWEFWK